MNYQDVMAIVRKHGKPSLFITFTCNPKWPEVVQNIEIYQGSEMRPELIACVFKQKLKELMKDISQKHVFGKVKYYLYIIEFQKRGLPHAHILVALHEEDVIREPSEIDLVVCAEIHNKETELELYEIVSKCMIHGPCGILNPSSPCMTADTGICSKKYPKSFQINTLSNINGYPQYRRRNDGNKIVVRVSQNSVELDNRWVVPYNKYLTKKYNAHINVEICSSIKSVKYLHKYIYKGYDCATVQIIEQQIDHFGLPADDLATENLEIENFNIHDEVLCGQVLKEQLNPEQKYIFDQIILAISTSNEVIKAFFIDGPGGSGQYNPPYS
ncbi:uncharacterized protein LOC118755017 [Rhagoletis pomonella]|uniref:uncharacterized protein LOC118755017 n=1 Tax=Rhagoletis pomonella TaxID=28610 RepID=UPI00177F2C92|nr:uncharacterized protein LOC118755017 [Rhagoletis pomonella]